MWEFQNSNAILVIIADLRLVKPYMVTCLKKGNLLKTILSTIF